MVKMYLRHTAMLTDMVWKELWALLFKVNMINLLSDNFFMNFVKTSQ